MKLYLYEHCPFCTRARLAIGLKNIPVELSVIMEGDSETPIRLVGRKVVPILQKDDGTCMPESMDIVRYIDGLAAPHWFLEPARPEVDKWCKESFSLMAKLAVPRFTEGDFRELATQEARTAYREREHKAFGDLSVLIEQTPILLAEMHQRLDALEPMLAAPRPISPSDFALFPVLRSLSIVKGLEMGPNALAYAQRLSTEGKVDLLFAQAR
jgi:glutaredoxin 2